MDPFRCFFDIVSSLALLVVSSFADTGTDQPTHRFGPISGVNPQKKVQSFLSLRSNGCRTPSCVVAATSASTRVSSKMRSAAPAV